MDTKYFREKEKGAQGTYMMEKVKTIFFSIDSGCNGSSPNFILYVL